VADEAGPALRHIAERRAFTHLRRALAGDGTFGTETLDRLEAVVAEQLACARDHGAGEVTVVATAAVRQARNPEVLVARLRERLGVELRILSETDEGHMAFRGACAALMGREADVAGTPLAVVDVGGGSSELVFGVAGSGPRRCVSLPLGSGVLTDAFLTDDPPAERAVAAAERRVDEVLATVTVEPPSRALAVGGSATSLCAMAGRRLDERAFAAALAVLLEAPAAAVAPRLGLDPQRVRLLPAGLLILRGFARRLGVALEPVTGGLREGVLLEGAGG
jgi:exopolyphosphatase/guanosine-5'-triphosphate,3'-diphosphate pyrophosphatase